MERSHSGLVRLLDPSESGEVPEWFKGLAWRASEAAMSPQVRILSSPLSDGSWSAGVPQGTAGSNPALSANFHFL